MKGAYYNEFDRKKATTLRELIRCGHIAPGDVDERSIVDVRPADLRGYTQCHFFAGFGVWSYALRLAGWRDEWPVWTASCPCQPFSSAGKRKGKEDERHLYPKLARLLGSARPVMVFGEQVSSKDGLAWLDDVFLSLEEQAYTTAAVDTCAAGFGAPHIRQRLYWMGIAQGIGSRTRFRSPKPGRIRRNEFANRSTTGEMGNPTSSNQQWNRTDESNQGQQTGRPSTTSELDNSSGNGRRAIGRVNAEHDRQQLNPTIEIGELGKPTGAGLAKRRSKRRAVPEECETVERAGLSVGIVADAPDRQFQEQERRSTGRNGFGSIGENGPPGPVNGIWRDADWILCRDDKWRPIEPGSFPLVNGAPERVGRLRGYGDAIVTTQAAAFVEAVIEELGL